MKTKRWLVVLLAVLAGSLILAGCEWDKDDDDDDHHKKNKNKNQEAPDNPGNPGNSGVPGNPGNPGNSASTDYYTVDFKVLGGPIPPSAQTVKFGEKVTAPGITDYSGNTYIVIWYTDQMFNVPYGFDSPVINDFTLYGKWQRINQATVNFIITGGPVPPPSQTVNYGEIITEPVVKDPSDNAYTVTWYKDQMFTGVPYSFDSPVAESFTLYGKWQQDGQQAEVLGLES